MIYKIVASRCDGRIRYADIYSERKRKVSVRPVAGRYQIVVSEGYSGKFSQEMVNRVFPNYLAMLDNRQQRSIVVDCGDFEKVQQAATELAKQI